MEIALQKKDGQVAELTVQIKPEDYKESVEKKVRDYSKKARINGFRPGKVPPQVIRRMMGKDLLAEEVYNLLNKKINGYIQEEKLRLLGDPLPSDGSPVVDFEVEGDYTFVYDLGLAPEFEVELSKLPKLTSYDVQVDAASVERMVTSLQREHGEASEPESVGEDDVITGQLTATGRRAEYDKVVSLPLDRMEEKYRRRLAGTTKGQKVEIDIKRAYAKDYALISRLLGISVDEASKLRGDFDLALQKIDRRAKHPLDQELFDKVFGPGNVTDEADFRTKVQEALQKSFERQAEEQKGEDLKEALIEKTKFELPSSFLKRWILATNQTKEDETPLSAEQIEDEFPRYEQELRWTLIQGKVIAANDIHVHQEEVVAKAKQQIAAQLLGGAEITPELEETLDRFAEGYLSENNGERYRQMQEIAVGEKVMAHLLSTAEFKAKTVDPEEFRKAVVK